MLDFPTCMSDNAPTKDNFHLLPAILPALAVLLLFVASRYIPEKSIVPIQPIDVQVKRPDGSAMQLDNAIAAGWIAAPSTATFSTGLAERMRYVLSNNSEKPIELSYRSTPTSPPKTIKLDPGSSTELNVRSPYPDNQIKVFMPVVVTSILLAGSLFVILAKRYQPSDRHWAYATIGTLVGYWLRG
ncbi:MAG TPA: hypothetical protein VGS27_07795 [Candidatus Sulfotelmatobacter sp.]|nr:hypothetical protein [Candidatus Sulfotelmatobacter sp.]